MKIAVWHNLPSGGGKRALYDHVKGLVKLGHHVESWCPQTADQDFLSLKEVISEHIVPLALPEKIEDRLKSMEEHCRSCALEINKGGFDLLFAGACTFFRTTPIAKYVQIPKVIYLGEPFRLFYEALPELPWAALPESKAHWWEIDSLKFFFTDWKRIQSFRVQLREEKLNAAAFDQILVNSFFSRESVMRAYGLDSSVCYLGVDPELFKPTGEKREKFVTGLGSVYVGKGIDRAIRAIETIDKSKRPNLMWIGNFSDWGYQKKMERLAESCGVTINFKINIPHEEMVSLLSRSSALIYPSRLEPFGLAVLEANACGTPVVGIAEGGVRESVIEGENGILVPDVDSVKLGQAIVKFSENLSLSSEMGKKARNFVCEKWNIDKAIKRLEEQLIELKDRPQKRTYSR